MTQDAFPGVELDAEEVQTLRNAIPDLKKKIASLKEDQDAGLDVAEHIARLETGLRFAEHALKKYGPAQRRGPRPIGR